MKRNGTFISCDYCKNLFYRSKVAFESSTYHFCNRNCSNSFKKGRSNPKHSQTLREGYASGRLKPWLSKNNGRTIWNKGLKGQKFLNHLKTGRVWSKGLTKETDERLERCSKRIGLALKGRDFSDEWKRKISLSKYGKPNHKQTAETRKKMRLSKINYIKNTKLQGMPLCPTIGKYEKEILDNLEKCIYPYKFIRQHMVAGYFIDGYCSALNFAIEVDELYHYKNERNIERDKNRQQEIEQELKCQFLRIQLPREVR